MRRAPRSRHTSPRPAADPVPDRLSRLQSDAEAQGLVGPPKDARVSGRVSSALVQRARERTGIQSTSDLIEAGLMELALADDFGKWLLEQEGRLSRDLDLEF